MPYEMNDLLEKMLEASGGIDLWKKTESIHLYGQMGGFMVAVKTIFHRSVYRNMLKLRDLEIFVHEQKMIFYNWPTEGIRGVYENGHARLENDDGTIVSERKNAKTYFFKNGGINNMLWWDILDFTYFIGYMFWNYFTAPHLFTFEGIQTKEIAPFVNEKGEKFRVLEALFPAYIHTHCRRQQYFVNEKGLIVQNRYQLDIGGLFKFRFHNFVTQYDEVDGLNLPTHRRIFFNWDTLFRAKRKQYTPSLPIWGTVQKAHLKFKNNHTTQHERTNFTRNNA